MPENQKGRTLQENAKPSANIKTYKTQHKEYLWQCVWNYENNKEINLD